MHSHTTIASLFYAQATEYGQKSFLEDTENRRLTYSHAASLVETTANTLLASGIKRWDRVIIFTPNNIEATISLIALNSIGAAVVIINEQTVDASLKLIYGELESTTVILDQSYLHKSELFQTSKILSLQDLVQVTEKAPNTSTTLNNDRPPQIIGNAVDPALLIYTSGSTGKPKGVVLSNDNILFATDKILKRLEYNDSDKIGLFLPFSFDYGLYQIFLTIQSGATLLIADAAFAGPALVKTLSDHKITVFPGVPHLYSLFTRFLARRKLALDHIRICTNTGAHLPGTQIEEIKEALPHVTVFPMYGLTECKRVSILLPNEMAEKPNSVGRPLDETEAFIVDDDGNILPAGEEGELIIIGRHLALGYWKAEKETALRYRTHPAGIGRALYTGDNFKMDEDGHLYFVGRRDEQIKRKGFRINRLEIENVALEIDGIESACIVALDTQLILFVETTKDDIDSNTIMEHLTQTLEPYKVPDVVTLRDSLPVSNNGKINRKQLQAEVEAQ